MKYTADHDFHIHSTVSRCCHDPVQTPEAILRYAIDNNYKRICLTNHFWDETVDSEAEWIEDHSFTNVSSVLPLPQADGIEFLFGCETDMDFNNILGISPARFDCFDFVIISTTHLQLDGNTVRTEVKTPQEAAFHWINKFESLLSKDIPFRKIGVAHLTCGHIFEKRTNEVIAMLPDAKLYEIFKECASKGLGIELNVKTIHMSAEEKEVLMRPYFIAKECGCKFYLGSDAHRHEALPFAKENFEDVISTLHLQESDKFIPSK